jgi:ubiquinone biosynthesis protein
MAASQIDIFTPWVFLVSLPSMLVVAWFAARLLGVRQRSWLSALIVGSLGWVLTGLFAIAVSNGRVQELSTAVITTFEVLATMTVTVALDLLHSHPPSHRPLRAVPHPVRATRTTLRRLHRYLRVLRIAARRGLAPYLGLRGDPKSAAAAAASTRMAIEDAGGRFVKLGQLLAGRADLPPTEARREFARLHESATPADPAAVLSMLEAELNAPPTEIFASFDTTPVRCPSGGVA